MTHAEFEARENALLTQHGQGSRELSPPDRDRFHAGVLSLCRELHASAGLSAGALGGKNPETCAVISLPDSYAVTVEIVPWFPPAVGLWIRTDPPAMPDLREVPADKLLALAVVRNRVARWQSGRDAHLYLGDLRDVSDLCASPQPGHR